MSLIRNTYMSVAKLRIYTTTFYFIKKNCLFKEKILSLQRSNLQSGTIAADFMVGVFCAHTLFTTKVLTKYRAVSWSRNAHGAFALKSLNST